MPIVHDGTWWVADHCPEQARRSPVAGTLTIDEDGSATLVLPSALPSLLMDPVDGVWRATGASLSARTVHGRTAHGLRITLLQVSGAPSVRAAMAIEGAWLYPDRPADLAAGTPMVAEPRTDPVPGEHVAAFTGIEVELQHLDAWSAAETLRRHQPHAPRTGNVLVERVASAEPSATLDDGATVTLVPAMVMNSEWTAVQNSVTVTETIIARITTPEPVSLTTLRRHVNSLRRLVGLAVRREASVLAAALHPARDTDAVEFDPPTGDDERVEPVTLHGAFRPVSREGTATPQRVLFTLRDLGLDVVLPRWQRNTDRLNGVLASLSIAGDPNALLEPRLMAAATAAETLHRVLDSAAPSETALPEADFALLRESIVAAVTATLAEHPHLRAHERPVLGLFHNRRRGPTLHTRLLALIDLLGEHAMPLLRGDHGIQAPDPDWPAESPSGSPEAKAWVQATKQARNGIAHHGLATGLGVQASAAVLRATVAVVELLVLRELGVDEQHLASLVRHQYYRVASQVRRHLLPLLGEDATASRSEPSPLVAAVMQAVAGAWRTTGWVDWAAVAAALRHHQVSADVSSHGGVTEALTGELGVLAPTPEVGFGQRPGWSAVALFAAVNDYCTATMPFPTSWWWRHRCLRPALRALPDLVGVAVEEVPDVLERRELTASDRDRLTLLAAEVTRLRAWFPIGSMPVDVGNAS